MQTAATRSEMQKKKRRCLTRSSSCTQSGQNPAVARLAMVTTALQTKNDSRHSRGEEPHQATAGHLFKFRPVCCARIKEKSTQATTTPRDCTSNVEP
mmetsp:Transcript_59317/g.114496  ORF Transcript_59317/g.114496 Transcript_59317/m.114496 type:complete len:97 (+) Transcript_59317:306-596(+)